MALPIQGLCLVLNGEAAGVNRSFGVFGETSPTTSGPGVRNPVMYGFTGREYDFESGLNCHRARYYNANAGRWLSQDPIGLESGDPNFYRYVGNEASQVIDPDGEAPILAPLAAGIIVTGGVVGGGMEVYSAYLKGERLGLGKSFRKGFIVASVGTTAGLLVGVRTKNAIATGAAAGAASEVTSQILEGKGIDVVSIAVNATISGLVGPVISKLPVLKTHGRSPYLMKLRNYGKLGKNSLRKIGQEAIGGIVSSGLFEGFKAGFETVTEGN